MDGSTLTRDTRTVAGQLTVDPSVEFGVAVQSQHQPATVLYDRHAARPESLSTVIRGIVRVFAAERTAHAVTRLRRTRMVDNDVVVVVIIIVIILEVVVDAGVVVLPRNRRMLDSAAAAKEWSERVADRVCRHSRSPRVDWEGS